MSQPKKLIEVAMPVKEVSAESVRDKSIRHGHISTLHLWWARRPLPVCRAVVFASLVPDPLDEHCPAAFKEAVELLLGKEENPGDPYNPYDDIPYTSIIDKVDDNLRNRLLMFIGKFSDKFIANEKQGKSTAAKDQISDASLIKWDNKNNEAIIGKARKLIWVAHNAKTSTADALTLLKDFDRHNKAIKEAEAALYGTKNRHIATEDIQLKEAALQQAIDAFLDKMPKVFDPFAGGGAIPLEAARLGCKSYGNDINPVAHIIQKGSLEFPQKYGKPISYTKEEFVKLYGREELVRWCKENSKHADAEDLVIDLPNRLSFDVEFYAKKLLAMAEQEVGHLYPPDEKGNKPIAYYWARVGTCSNPSCKAEVPLLKNFYLVKNKSKQVYLNPIINKNSIEFEIKHGYSSLTGWNNRTILTCPLCGSITESKQLKEQFRNGDTSEKILAVIEESSNGKAYRLPTNVEIQCFSEISPLDNLPIDKLEVGNKRNFNTPGWGIDKFSQLFNKRQMISLQSLIKNIQIIGEENNDLENNYFDSIITYLSILVNRLATRLSSFGLYNTIAETIEHPFGRQAIPMVFDYPETNPFTLMGGGGLSQLSWILRYIDNESFSPIYTICNNSSSGDKEQFPTKEITAVITDPPYYDAIAYADLSDFFYIWFKKMLSNKYPLNFATPKTPKSEECTALKHHHQNNDDLAKRHFETKLTQIFDAIEHQTSDIVSIMFAHQSTEAWTTLCNSILDARMNITGSWAIDTERSSAGVKANQAFLSSSVTVSCIPSQSVGLADYKDVKNAIEETVSKEVEELYKLGFRGADLLTACFGQAVSEFGKYEKVEKADGTEVTVAELLEMAKESAFNALLKGFAGDEPTKFYIGWLQLYGFTETDFDDAAKLTRVGLSINVQDLFTQNIFIKNGNKQTLAGYKDRNNANKKLGEAGNSLLIDKAHKAMYLYDPKTKAKRTHLLQFLAMAAPESESPMWRVLSSIVELTKGSDDGNIATQLLVDKDNLVRESKTIETETTTQTKMDF
ncbi:MAG: DUF1156 domain-containing protein [Chitinophagales bacterium]|nr:DUF1156 domain-containing protein [Chitinophagales bacterium]